MTIARTRDTHDMTVFPNTFQRSRDPSTFEVSATFLGYVQTARSCWRNNTERIPRQWYVTMPSQRRWYVTMWSHLISSQASSRSLRPSAYGLVPSPWGLRASSTTATPSPPSRLWKYVTYVTIQQKYLYVNITMSCNLVYSGVL